jgi:hypothetical protein
MTSYAIADIHGGNTTFRALLDILSLKHSDRLNLMGDYIDRGNDSKGVFDTILGLIRMSLCWNRVSNLNRNFNLISEHHADSNNLSEIFNEH